MDAEGLKEKDSIYFLEENLDGSHEGAVVVENSVKSMNIEYLDQEDNTWLDSWDSEKGYLPVAIKIRLRFNRNGKTIESPEIVTAIRAGER